MTQPKKKKGGLGATGKRLFGYIMKRHKAAFAVVFVCIVISALAGVAGSMFLQILIDDYITPLIGAENPVFTALLQAILTMAGIYAIGVVATYLYNRFMVVIAQGVLKEIRDSMFAHMQTLPIRYFDTHAHGDIMSYYTNDTDTLRQFVAQSIPQIFSCLVSIVTVFAAMLVISIPLTILILVMVAIMLVAISVIGGRSSKHFVKQQGALAKVNGYIEEMTQGQRVVKVFCHEKASKEGFDGLNEDLFKTAAAANSYANILMPVMFSIGNLSYVLVAIAGGAMAVAGIGGMTLGAIAAFLQLVRSFTTPISQIAQQLNSVIMAMAGAQRIFTLLDEEPEEDDGTVTLVNVKYSGDELVETDERTYIWAWKRPNPDGTAQYTKLTGDVRLSHVNFGYNPDKQVLKDISLYASSGEKVAFVGATGAGKTTITNLINRFYDIQSGTIAYDGIDIKEICKKDLRLSLGIVLQDVNLFTGTILENIRYGRPGATDEEVCAAAQLTNAHDFITRLPDGYNTVLTGDGSELSQGQRQLISIARAAAADPPVMIMDEATSSIDTRTERVVQEGMDSLMYGRTVFVIAHRLSTIQNADVIMVMQMGEIIERGSHEELIKEKGQYYQLYTGAFELE